MQLEPQLLTLAFEEQLLEQRCEPAEQVEQTFPEQYWLAQSLGTAQATPFAQAFPCETQTPPQSTPVSLWFLIASEQESGAQEPPLGWKPPLQVTNTQVPELQVPTPFA